MSRRPGPGVEAAGIDWLLSGGGSSSRYRPQPVIRAYAREPSVKFIDPSFSALSRRDAQTDWLRVTIGHPQLRSKRLPP